MLKPWREFRLFVICALISLGTNYPPAVMNSSVNTAVAEFKRFIAESYSQRGIELSESAQTIIRGTILNVWYVAQFVGAMTLPDWLERFGRKREFLVAVSGMAAGSALQLLAVLSSLPELFLFGRFLAGLCSPLCDVAQIMFLQECTPTDERGTYSFLAGTGYALLSAVGMVLGMRSVLGESFLTLIAVQLFPVLLSIPLALVLPETPKFLMIERNDRKAAMKSLVFFQGEKDDNEAILDHFLLEAEKKADAPEQPHMVHSATTRELFTTPYLRFTMILACVEFVFMLPFFPILQSSTFFFEQTGIELNIAEMSTTILFIAHFLAGIVGFLLIDRFPRRTLILGAGSLSTVALSGYVVFAADFELFDWFKYASLGFIGLYVVIYGMVLGPLSLFISSELATQRYRSRVFSFCFGFTNVLITLTNWISLLAFQKVGAIAFVPLFIVPYAGAVIFLSKYLPETRNKEVYEVVDAIKHMVAHRSAKK
ncbi:Solute carrier family 2, facilitated glucose transporter member 1 [Aphelenchoides fujianensis]|nr:Solute carrier family 2, facilitated glucose transporter member 1 [Aphelenchoides fujianensis]